VPASRLYRVRIHCIEHEVRIIEFVAEAVRERLQGGDLDG
jgi:hypothetical protein